MDGRKKKYAECASFTRTAAAATLTDEDDVNTTFTERYEMKEKKNETKEDEEKNIVRKLYRYEYEFIYTTVAREFAQTLLQ